MLVFCRRHRAHPRNRVRAVLPGQIDSDTTSEQQRSNALCVWNAHYNHHRPHGAAGGQPPAAMLDQRVTNVVASYL